MYLETINPFYLGRLVTLRPNEGMEYAAAFPLRMTANNAALIEAQCSKLSLILQCASVVDQSPQPPHAGLLTSETPHRSHMICTYEQWAVFCFRLTVRCVTHETWLSPTYLPLTCVCFLALLSLSLQLTAYTLSPLTSWVRTYLVSFPFTSLFKYDV